MVFKIAQSSIYSFKYGSYIVIFVSGSRLKLNLKKNIEEMTNIIWSQFTDLQKIDLSHKCAENLPPGISQCEGVESVNVNSPLF